MATKRTTTKAAVERPGAMAGEGSVVGPSPARNMYAARIGSALTPRRISTIMTMADTGYVSAWHDLLNEIRQKDGALHSVLQTRETALLSKGWDLSPWKEEGSDDVSPQDEEIAGFCRGAIREIKGFERNLAHLCDAVYKAFSISEILWKKRADGALVPHCLNAIQGRRWKVSQEQTLGLYDGAQYAPPLEVIRDYPSRFIVHTPRVNGDQLAREGLGRCLVW